MKKFLALALSLCLIFALAACGEESKPESAKYPEGYKLHISDNLPDVIFQCGYNDYGETLLEDYAGYAIESAYVPVDPNRSVIAIYRWANEEGVSLMDAAKSDIKVLGDVEGNKIEGIEPVEYSGFYEEGDYDYVYYVFSESDGENTYFYQDYYFMDGNDIVVYEYADRGVLHEYGDGTVFLNFPALMTEQTLTEEDKENKVAAKFVDTEYNEYIETDLYIWEKEDKDIDYILQWFKDEYDVQTVVDDPYENLPSFVAFYDEDADGKTYYNEEYVLELEDKFVTYRFRAERDDRLMYKLASIPALQHDGIKIYSKK